VERLPKRRANNQEEFIMSDEVKKLHRSKEDRVLAGVCGGLAAYFNIDPTIIRVIFIVLALFGGGSIILYLLLWILIPEAPEELANIEISAETEDNDQ
jgi:phage shock protein C